jgi:hypothetical protein
MTKRKEGPEKPIENNLKIPELEIFKQISMLNSLATACEDETLVSAFNNLKNGERLYEIFIKAVHSEIQDVVNGKERKAAEKLKSAESLANSVYDTAGLTFSMLQAIGRSPVMQVLAIVHDKMTGTSLAEVLARSSSASPPPSTEVPVPHSDNGDNRTPEAEAPAQGSNPPLTKKYAANRLSDERPAATVMPPRGNGINGMF